MNELTLLSIAVTLFVIILVFQKKTGKKDIIFGKRQSDQIIQFIIMDL